MNVEIKPITVSDYIVFFNEYPKWTIRGYSFFVDNNIVAVFGALLNNSRTMLFSDVKHGINISPIIIWRWAKRGLSMINDLRQPLYATSENSGRFLSTLGFEHIGKNYYRYMG